HRKPADSDRDSNAFSGKPDPWNKSAGPEAGRRSSMIRLLLSIWLTIAGCLACAGCVSTRPVHYYTLDAPAPPANQGKPDGLVLLVGSITTPEGLQDGRIRYRAGSNEAGAYEYHRWTEWPGRMVRDALVRALADLGDSRRGLD